MSHATHREVKKPQISARDLADFMAAGTRERAKRSIIRDSKYRSIGRVIQHDEAKTTISSFFTSGNQDVSSLFEKAEYVRNKLADSEFDEDLNGHNADYIKRFATVYPELTLPDGEISAFGKAPALTLNGVKVTIEIAFRLRRVTKTNKVKIGGAMLRYAKGKPLEASAGDWQSAFLFGYLGEVKPENAADPEHKLCLTLDAYAGETYHAPSKSVSMFHEMAAACATIAERWPNIEPPANAIF